MEAHVSEDGGNSHTTPIPSIQSTSSPSFPIGDEETHGIDASLLPASSSGNKRKRSEVWNHFTKKKIDGVDKAICNYCSKLLGGQSTVGTTHLKSHYEKACTKRPRKVDIKQMLLSGNVKASGKSDLSFSSYDESVSRYELSVACILHDYPLSIVEHYGFRRFVRSLNGKFKLISRNTLKSDIMKICEEEKQKAYRIFDKLSCRIAVTTDMWTSKNTKRGYMVVTSHLIDEDWQLQSCILRFAYVPAPHTAENLSDELSRSLMDWNIDIKVSSITVDNCMTNDAMLKVMLTKLSEDDMILNGKVLHMRCVAHILNIIVQTGLDKLEVGIEKVRDSVVFWSAPKRVEKFKEMVRQLKINCTKELSIDCKTRWNSTYLMLETDISYEKVFQRLALLENAYKTCPSMEDWENAKIVCDKLKIFLEVTEMISGTNYPTSNCYFSKICIIKKRLEKWFNTEDEIDMVREMAGVMLEKYLKYWDDVHIIMGVAVVLDPRYKLKLIEFHFKTIFGSLFESKVDEVRENCKSILVDYQNKVHSLGSRSHISDGSSLTRTMEIDEEDYDVFVASQNELSAPSKSELDQYLEEPVLPRSPDFDVLGWWKTQGSKFPCFLSQPLLLSLHSV